LFYDEIDARAIQIENLEDDDLEKHQELFEVEELKRLETQIQKVEEQKIELMRRERFAEGELMVEAGAIGLSLDQLENRNEYRLKERERALTKLYARMNSKFRYAIWRVDGLLTAKQRKIKKYMDPKKKEKMLFDGIRD